MNRLIFIIACLLAIFYIYKQSKKQTKIIEKLTLRINTLEKNNKLELKNKPNNSQVNKTDQKINLNNTQVNKSDPKINLNNMTCKNDTTKMDTCKNDTTKMNTCKNDTTKMTTCKIQTCNTGPCKIQPSSKLTTPTNEYSTSDVQEVLNIEKRLHKFYQDSDVLDVLNQSNHTTASIIFDTNIYPIPTQSNNVVEIESVGSMPDSEFSLESTENTSIDMSNIMNVNGLESDTLTDIQEEFDKNFQNLIQSDTGSELNDDNESDLVLPPLNNEQTAIHDIKHTFVNNVAEGAVDNAVENTVENVGDNDEVNSVENVGDNVEDNVEDNNDIITSELSSNINLINEVNYTFTTKKYALENKDICCAIKKFGPNIGKIGNKLNVPAQDYLFIKYNDKKLFYDKMNNVTFSKNTILTKQNFGDHITF